MTLQEMTAEIERVNREKGWYDDPRSFGDLIALLHSEVSEALEAYRDHGTDDWVSGKPGDEVFKPEGVGSELADVLIRLLDLAGRYEIDLEAEYRKKIEYNRTRSHRHGGKRL